MRVFRDFAWQQSFSRTLQFFSRLLFALTGPAPLIDEPNPRVIAAIPAYKSKWSDESNPDPLPVENRVSCRGLDTSLRHARSKTWEAGNPPVWPRLGWQ